MKLAEVPVFAVATWVTVSVELPDALTSTRPVGIPSPLTKFTDVAVPAFNVGAVPFGELPGDVVQDRLFTPLSLVELP